MIKAAAQSRQPGDAERSTESGPLPNERVTSLRRNIYVTAVSNSVAVSANSLWIVFMPYYFANLGLEKALVGLVFTAQAAALACMSLVGGVLADRIGRKPTIILGMFVY